MENQKPVTLDEISKIISDNNKVLIPLMGNMMDEKIKANNDILIPLIDKKIKDNNDILIPLIDKKIKDNNDILIPLIDKKIKDNNEYIFENFNNQTERILNLFKGVVMVRRDGTFTMYV
jgi:hypothetical protein